MFRFSYDTEIVNDNVTRRKLDFFADCESLLIAQVDIIKLLLLLKASDEYSFLYWEQLLFANYVMWLFADCEHSSAYHKITYWKHSLLLVISCRKVLREAASGGRDAERVKLKLEVKVEVRKHLDASFSCEGGSLTFLLIVYFIL